MKVIVLSISLLWTLPNSVHCQSFEKDLLLLNTNESILPEQQKKNGTWNPLALGYQLGIKIYQKGISEQLATSCAFELSCSRFSSAMVKDYGFFKGYFLTFDRLSRCTKLTVIETFPVRLNRQNRIIETPTDFHFR